MYRLYIDGEYYDEVSSLSTSGSYPEYVYSYSGQSEGGLDEEFYISAQYSSTTEFTAYVYFTIRSQGAYLSGVEFKWNSE